MYTYIMEKKHSKNVAILLVFFSTTAEIIVFLDKKMRPKKEIDIRGTFSFLQNYKYEH